MKQLFILILLLFSIEFTSAQEKSGTIKVEKRDMIIQVSYDNVNYRLIGIDQYGNILDSTIQEFELKTTIKGIAYSEKAVGHYLTRNMQKVIGRCDGECKLFFSNIIVKDKFGNLIKAKPFVYTFGYIEKSFD